MCFERKDDIISFGKASIDYRVKNKGYEAEIIVGLKDDGSAIVYDLINIKSKKIIEAISGGNGKNAVSSTNTPITDTDYKTRSSESQDFSEKFYSDRNEPTDNITQGDGSVVLSRLTGVSFNVVRKI